MRTCVRWAGATDQCSQMTYPAYIRDKARQLRRDKKLTMDEIAERLALPRTTVYYWIRDLPIERKPATGFGAAAREAAVRANRRRFKALRDHAYAEGLARFPELCLEPSFRDFVCLYIAEGFKRNRNVVSIANSDPAVLHAAVGWMRRESARFLEFSVQYHADQDLDELRMFWGQEFGIDPESIRLQRKSNSSQLQYRTWRCEYGVLTIRTNDTYFRARLQAWIDCLRMQWLDSPNRGVAQPG